MIKPVRKTLFLFSYKVLCKDIRLRYPLPLLIEKPQFHGIIHNLTLNSKMLTFITLNFVHYEVFFFMVGGRGGGKSLEFFEISRFKKLTIILHKKTNYYFTSKKNRAFLHICPLRPQLNPKPYFTCIKPCIYLELSLLSIYLKLLFCLHNERRTQKLNVILPVEPLKWGGGSNSTNH